MGIDIGSADLVGSSRFSPKDIVASPRRIGRAGHHVGGTFVDAEQRDDALNPALQAAIQTGDMD